MTRKQWIDEFLIAMNSEFGRGFKEIETETNHLDGGAMVAITLGQLNEWGEWNWKLTTVADAVAEAAERLHMNRERWNWEDALKNEKEVSVRTLRPHYR